MAPILHSKTALNHDFGIPIGSKYNLKSILFEMKGKKYQKWLNKAISEA